MSQHYANKALCKMNSWLMRAWLIATKVNWRCLFLFFFRWQCKCTCGKFHSPGWYSESPVRMYCFSYMYGSQSQKITGSITARAMKGNQFKCTKKKLTAVISRTENLCFTHALYNRYIGIDVSRIRATCSSILVRRMLVIFLRGCRLHKLDVEM